jgi:hypothetical protein
VRRTRFWNGYTFCMSIFVNILQKRFLSFWIIYFFIDDINERNDISKYPSDYEQWVIYRLCHCLLLDSCCLSHFRFCLLSNLSWSHSRFCLLSNISRSHSQFCLLFTKYKKHSSGNGTHPSPPRHIWYQTKSRVRPAYIWQQTKLGVRPAYSMARRGGVGPVSGAMFLVFGKQNDR